MIAGFESENVHHERAAAAVGATIARGDTMLLPASAYAELMVQPAAGGDSLLARADDLVDELGILVVPADRDIARAAARHLLTTGKAWKRLRNLGVRGLTVVGERGSAAEPRRRFYLAGHLGHPRLAPGPTKQVAAGHQDEKTTSIGGDGQAGGLA